jgi:hypothetical protein
MILNHPDPIAFLVSRKYPKATKPVALPSVANPYKMSAKAPTAEKLYVEAQKYRAELMAMPQDRFEALYQEELDKFKEELRAAADAKERALFFNQPHANADFDHWSRAAHWTLEEAVALSFGKEPSIVNSNSIAPYSQTSRFAGQFSKRLDLARRAVPWKKLFDPVLPGIFIGWTKENQIPFPSDLEALLSARGNMIVSWKSNYEALSARYDDLQSQFLETQTNLTKRLDEERQQLEEAQKQLADAEKTSPAKMKPEIGQREKESLLKLVIGLAIGGYGFDPKSARNAKLSEISSDLATAGVPLDDDTIRKWLKAGVELLPSSETE